jgi:hypothetical protein
VTIAIEKDWLTSAGYRAVVIRCSGALNHRCGYVGIDATHPLFGAPYYEPCARVSPPPDDEQIGDRGIVEMVVNSGKAAAQLPLSVVFDVHGSLTYSGNGSGRYPVVSDLWWFGFDAAHYLDDEDGGRPLLFMIDQCESLAAQLTSRLKVTP